MVQNLPADAGDTRDAGSISWSRKWQPAVVFLPGKFHGERSLAGCSPLGCKESDMIEHTHMTLSISEVVVVMYTRQLKHPVYIQRTSIISKRQVTQ